jgi:hypothetical protein
MNEERIRWNSDLPTPHIETREGVFECLFESKEFQDGEGNAGMKPKSALVRADGGIELIIGNRRG